MSVLSDVSFKEVKEQVLAVLYPLGSDGFERDYSFATTGAEKA
ncbi:hypothetical protein QT234_08790 [Geobacillus stearothermophilus]|nr:hypothetical protein QT234_08790 [Geobacillus stearothermophilus]